MSYELSRITSASAGALVGASLGDALAMPVHWYYNRAALAEDYGLVTNFLPPKNPHPDSILWRSRYEAENAKGEILHDQARYWGQRGIHYHQHLRAGENTLTQQLAHLLQESLLACEGYDPDNYLARYIAFLTTPGSHRDTYIEECHRGFFGNYARGRDPRNCGIPEKHIGGLPAIIPLAVWYQDAPDAAHEHCRDRLSLTHPGDTMTDAASLLLAILLPVLKGAALPETIQDLHARQISPLLGFSLKQLLKLPDEEVIGPRFSSACYLDESIPATIYLAAKYHSNPEDGLIANTNLGGDNVHRGALLGALLGAANGFEAWPERWRNKLLRQPPLLNGYSPSGGK